MTGTLKRLFQAPCEELHSRTAIDFAVLHSRKRQAVTLLSEMVCEQQWLFASAEAGWASVVTNLSDGFAQANGFLGYENVGALFVPTAQQAALLQGLNNLVERWSAGADTQALGYFANGLYLLGVVHVPDGVVLAYAQDGEWMFCGETMVALLGEDATGAFNMIRKMCRLFGWHEGLLMGHRIWRMNWRSGLQRMKMFVKPVAAIAA